MKTQNGSTLKRFSNEYYFFQSTKTHVFCQLVDLLDLGTHPKYQAFLSLPNKNRTYVFSQFLGGIARKPLPVTVEGCSIDVTYLTDIFTVGRPNIVKNKPKISAQSYEPFLRYRVLQVFWSTIFQ